MQYHSRETIRCDRHGDSGAYIPWRPAEELIGHRCADPRAGGLQSSRFAIGHALEAKHTDREDQMRDKGGGKREGRESQS